MSEIRRIYGEGRTSVPGLLIDGTSVHGSRPILARLEQLVPDPMLYPESIADAVPDAERWGHEELQDLGRRLPWGACISARTRAAPLAERTARRARH